MLNSIARRTLRGHAGRRLARAVPNPVLRYAVVSVASALLPVLMGALAKRRTRR